MRLVSVLLLSACLSTAALADPVAPSSGSPQTSAPAGSILSGSNPEPASSDGLGRDFTLSVGGSWLSGDFGAASNTRVWSVPFGIRYKTGNLRLTANIPYMNIKSDGLLFTGIDGTPLVVAPREPNPKHVRSGMGDLTLGAAYDIPSSVTSGFDVELQGRIKVPTAADSSGLSTGKTDFLVGTQISRQIGPVRPFVSVNYRFFGDMKGWNLRNGAATSVGASFDLGKLTFVGSYDWTRAASRFVGDSHELLGAVGGPIGHRMRWATYGTVGLSRGAPDGGAGLTLSLDV